LTARVTGPSHGALSLDASGNFVYEPAAGYVGADSFTFAATDGVATDTGMVTIDVYNTAPVANDQTESTPHDQPLSSMVSG
jgi:VCBS repeat-containing protein